MTDNRPMAYKCSIDGERLLYSVQYGFYLLFCEINDWLILPIICSIDAELEDLREFYDPDTVDLMQWIQQNTHQVMTLIFNLSFWKARTRQYGRMFEPPAEVQLIPDKHGDSNCNRFHYTKRQKSHLWCFKYIAWGEHAWSHSSLCIMTTFYSAAMTGSMHGHTPPCV